MDLAYIPNHCSAKNVDQEFFKRVRSAYYVVSGNDAASGEPSRGVLDALLDGKAQWGSNLQVCSDIEANLKKHVSHSLRQKLKHHPFAYTTLLTLRGEEIKNGVELN